MSETHLDWSTAEVDDGQLSVALDGKPSPEWVERFETTVTLLNHGNWEKVKLKKDEVRVRPVLEGEEDKLRHFLESVVLEANSAAGEDDSADDAEPASEDDSAESSADHEMTERFRDFGASEPAEES
jgi:hypothetical protein